MRNERKNTSFAGAIYSLVYSSSSRFIFSSECAVFGAQPRANQFADARLAPPFFFYSSSSLFIIRWARASFSADCLSLSPLFVLGRHARVALCVAILRYYLLITRGITISELGAFFAASSSSSKRDMSRKRRDSFTLANIQKFPPL